MTTGRLSLDQRRRDLDELRRGTVDVLVVGGGVVGAGSALDAATRGLTVGLIERDDWASGTSSRSSRLAHGGLRYLEQLEFGLVHEALTERGLLLERIAPHLVRPVRFVFPLSARWERPYVGAGVALYDVLARFGARSGSLPGHRHLSKRAALRLVPGLEDSALAGAITFFDAQIDDARHTLATVRTAAAHGALVASRVEATGLLREGDAVCGVRAHDHVTGETFDVRARGVLAALGVWGGRVPQLLGEDEPERAVVPSKGVHLVVRRKAIDSHTAVIARTASSVLFLLPWGSDWLVGTTDTPWQGGIDSFDDVVADRSDVDYLLDEANRWLHRPLLRDDIVATYAGLRPLVPETEESDTARISREHVVTTPVPGLVSVTGGKYTTYRVMAADAVDAVVEQLPSELGVGPSRTAGIPLVGAEGYAALWAEREQLAADWGVSPTVAARLLRRHGDQVGDVVDLLREDPALAEPVAGSRYLAAELVQAVRAEGALSLSDVLLRRTHLGLEVPDVGAAALPEVARLVAATLGWDDEERSAQEAAYLAAAPTLP
jgi:glycerol-3-phosphate dehydrogenase